MAADQIESKQGQVFSHRVRTLSADELEKVVGGEDWEGHNIKNLSAQDNQAKSMT